MDKNIKLAKDLVKLAKMLMVADGEEVVEEEGKIDQSAAKGLLKDLEGAGDNFEDEVEELGEEMEDMAEEQEDNAHRIVASKVITASVAHGMLDEVRIAANNVIRTASIYKNARQLKTAGFWDSFNKSRKAQINPEQSFTKKAKDALIKAVKALIDKLVKILKSIAVCAAGVAYMLVKGAIFVIEQTCKALIKMGVLAKNVIQKAFSAVTNAFKELMDDIKVYREEVKRNGQEAVEKFGKFKDYIGSKIGTVVGVVQNELMGLFA